MPAFSTDNPRHLRALGALMRGPLTRTMLDEVSGAANSPDMVQELRSRGLQIPCKRVDALDRDGRPCKPGVYHLTAADRRLIARFIKRRANNPTYHCPVNSNQKMLAEMTPAEYERHKREQAERLLVVPRNAHELTPEQWAAEKRRLNIR